MSAWRRLRDAFRAALIVWRADGFIRVEDMERLDRRKQWVLWQTPEHVNCRCAINILEWKPSPDHETAQYRSKP